MEHQTSLAGAKQRRTREEIRQMVAEFATSGMRPSEYCRNRGVSRSTLDRHLRKQRAQDQGSGVGHRVLAVEVRAGSGSWAGNSGGLVVRLSSGHGIEVNRDFDAATLERLLMALERL